MSSNPALSIIMAVFNGEKTVERSINSILKQTWNNFEFIVVDDASTDSTQKLIKQYTDPRIKLMVNSENIGLPSSLNKAIEIAKGEYVGRMDADDISTPKRFSVQIDFMERNRHVGVCGTWVRVPGLFIKPLWKYPCEHEEIKALLLFESCLAHPTVVFRKSAFNPKSLRYNESYRRGQDYEMWGRIVHEVQFATISQALLQYQPQDIHSTYNIDCQVKLVRDKLIDRSGLELTDTEKELHHKICTLSRTDATMEKVLEAERYFKKLLVMSAAKECFENEVFTKVIAGRWYKTCYAAIKNGIPLLRLYFMSNIRKRHRITEREIVLVARSLLRR